MLQTVFLSPDFFCAFWEYFPLLILWVTIIMHELLKLFMDYNSNNASMLNLHLNNPSLQYQVLYYSGTGERKSFPAPRKFLEKIQIKSSGKKKIILVTQRISYINIGSLLFPISSCSSTSHFFLLLLFKILFETKIGNWDLIYLLLNFPIQWVPGDK